MRSSYKMDPRVLAFLTTFRRLPDEIVLGIMGSNLDLESPSQCVVGYAVRAAIAEPLGVDASEVTLLDIHTVGSGGMVERAQTFYGGTWAEWNEIFGGVVNEKMPLIEEALALRLDEIVKVRARRSPQVTRTLAEEVALV